MDDALRQLIAEAAIEFRRERDFRERLCADTPTNTQSTADCIRLDAAAHAALRLLFLMRSMMTDFQKTADILRVTANVLDAIAHKLATDWDRYERNGAAVKDIRTKAEAMRMAADVLVPNPVVNDNPF